MEKEYFIQIEKLLEIFMRVDLHQKELFTSYLSNEINQKFDFTISGISTDSRNIKKGDLFLGIRGKFFDGSNFVQEAMDNGAICSLKETGKESDNIFVTSDVIMLLGKICSRWMNDFQGYTVAITGTNGKTTTKDLMYHILKKAGYRVCKTEGNFNTSIGVPLNIFSFPENIDFYVLEFGASEEGDIKNLSSMIEPNCGIVTNISNAHLDGFGSYDNIVREKTSIFKFSSIGFFGSSRSFNYENKNVSFLGAGAREFEYPNNLGSMFDNNKALLENAFTVFSACRAIIDLSTEDFFNYFKDFSLPKGRGKVHRVGSNIKLIDDAYNANPGSVKAAIDNINSYENVNRKIFVFGDMKELGRNSVIFHEEVGEYCSGKFDMLLCYGTLAKNTINDSNKIAIQLHFDTKESLSKYLNKKIRKNDLILFKGSRGMKLELIIEDIIKNVK